MEFDALRIRIQRSENLPVLPQVVDKILKLVDDPDTSPKEIERVVESDAAVTAKILRVANSPYYGSSGIPTVARAISVLGANALKSLVVGVAYQQMIGSDRSTSVHFDRTAFWRHSIAVAAGTRLLARYRMPKKAEELYVIGMMHDVGMLVLERFAPQDFDTVLARTGECGLPIHEVEEELFGHDHAAVGALLAERWGLTPMIRSGIQYHHEPDRDHEFAASTALVSIANTLAHQAGFSNNEPEGIEYELEMPILEAAQITLDQCAEAREIMAEGVEQAEQMVRAP